MKISSGTLIVLLITILTVFAVGTALWGRHLAQPGPLENETTVVIAPGTSPRSIATQLAGQGVIANPTTFLIALRLFGLAPTLKAGEYHFPPHISLRTVINKLATGDTAPERTLTIPEGFTVKQAIERLNATPELTGQAPIPEEGMLFPDTYNFTYGTPRQKLVTLIQQRMEKELTQAWANRHPNLPLTSPQEMLILASIIQKEAANEKEMPTISSVFINRLNKGMKLQSDPTVIYGAELQENNIRKKDLREEHPFNTYIHQGLPPTPIANPGRAALIAAAQPATTPYLFFVSNPSRTAHIFTETYPQHQKHVKAYWQHSNAKPSK